MLITSSSRGQECTAALQKAAGEEVALVASVRAALRLLRRTEYSALVVDENLLEANPREADSILAHAGTAVPVYVNFGISSSARLVREAQAALRRARDEHLIAMKRASAALRNQMRSALTGILLSSELALAVPALPPAAEVKIKFVRELAESLRQQLERVA